MPHFLSSARSRAPQLPTKSCPLASFREVAVLRSFVQLLALTGKETEYAVACRSSTDNVSTTDRPRHEHGAGSPVGSPRALGSPRAPASPLSPKDLSQFSPRSPRSQRIDALDDLHALQLVDIPQLMDAMKRLNLPASALAALIEALRESVVAAELNSAKESVHFVFSGCDNHPCSCNFYESGDYVIPETQTKVLESAMAKDPEIAQWLQSTLGIHG
eukprot:jgi/Mesvir1/13124/Mv06098-RA.1